MFSPEGGYVVIGLEAVGGGQYGVLAIDDVSLAYGSCMNIDVHHDITNPAGKIHCTKTKQNLNNKIRFQTVSARCIVHWRVSL